MLLCCVSVKISLGLSEFLMWMCSFVFGVWVILFLNVGVMVLFLVG